LSELTKEQIYELRPALSARPRGSGKLRPVQISYPGDRKREQMPFVIPDDELAALDAFAQRVHGRLGHRSEVVRDAVSSLATRLGLVSKSPARLQVERTAKMLGRDPDELADDLGIKGPAFRSMLKAVALAGKLYWREGELSEARAIRWAVSVYLAENT
jgi:hypothetical protein